MTTLEPASEHRDGRRTAPVMVDAGCPHCGALMEPAASIPWPQEPALCPSCMRWVGRGRAVRAAYVETDGTGTPDDVAENERTADALPTVGSARRTLPPGRRPRPRPASRHRGGRELGPPPVPPLLSRRAAGSTGLHSARGSDGPTHGEHDLDPETPAPFEPASSLELSIKAARESRSESSPKQAPRSEEARTGFARADASPPGEQGASSSTWSRESDAPLDGKEPLGPPAPFCWLGASRLEASTDENGASALEPELMQQVPPEHADRPHPETTVSSEEPGRRRLRLSSLRPSLPRRPKFGRPTRAGLRRALPVLLVVAGGLGLLEGGVTLLWKEPFSALLTAQNEEALGKDLEALERASAAEASEAARSRQRTIRYQQRQAVRLRRGLAVGEPIGRLRIDKMDLNKVVVNGSDEEVSLKKGLGQHVETPLPGQKGDWTTGIAGHRTTYGAPFRDIDKLDKGDKIVYSLPYGRYTYEVEKTRIVDADYTKAFLPQGADKLLLYACYPLYSDAQRIMVSAKLKKSEPRGGAQQAART